MGSHEEHSWPAGTIAGLGPAWSPDGQALAFGASSVWDVGLQLYVTGVGPAQAWLKGDRGAAEPKQSIPALVDVTQGRLAGWCHVRNAQPALEGTADDRNWRLHVVRARNEDHQSLPGATSRAWPAPALNMSRYTTNANVSASAAMQGIARALLEHAEGDWAEREQPLPSWRKTVGAILSRRSHSRLVAARDEQEGLSRARRLWRPSWIADAAAPFAEEAAAYAAVVARAISAAARDGRAAGATGSLTLALALPGSLHYDVLERLLAEGSLVHVSELLVRCWRVGAFVERGVAMREAS